MLPRRSDGAPPLALIVDRDDSTRLLYRAFFEFSHWRVIGAAAGPEALAKAIAERPDVVISETSLPGFDGVALSERLRADFATAHIPIVFVTCDATAANLARAEAAGAQAVLTKPCFPEELLKAVDTACRRAENLRARGSDAQARSRESARRARDVAKRAVEQKAAISLKKALQRGDTIVPPIKPPPLRCTECGDPLKYLRSHLGGVSIKHSEQWDYFECRTCGIFEYRARTRKIRRVD
jgi:CheY-like chemotaxis protein